MCWQVYEKSFVGTNTIMQGWKMITLYNYSCTTAKHYYIDTT